MLASFALLTTAALTASGFLSPMYRAARQGDAAEVRRLLENKADVGGADAAGLTPLHAAVLAGSSEIAALLCGAGADVTARTTQATLDAGHTYPAGITPLQMATAKHDPTLVKMLEAAQDRVLCDAVAHQRVELLKRLLGLGANAQQSTCYSHDAPLAEAASLGNAKIVDLLLDHGAVVDTEALQAALQTSNDAIIQAFIKHGARLNDAWQHGDFFGQGWHERQSRRAKWCLDAGLNPNLMTDAGTPIFQVLAQDPALVKPCLSHGGDVRLRSASGDTVLHVVVQTGNLAAVKAVVEAHADIDVENQAGMTPLAWAVRAGQVPLVSYLIEHGASVRHVSGDASRTTMAIWAALSGSVDVLQEVVRHGADVTAVDAQGQTPLHWARNGAVAEALLQKHVDVNARDQEGNTPLHSAVSQEDSGDLVEVLLKHQADVNAVNDDGQTPLHVADAAYVPTLLAYHADVSRVDKLGRTPLLTQLEHGDAGALALLRAGADARVRDVHGWTALHWAVIGDAADAAQLLLKQGLDVNAAARAEFHYKTDDVDITFPAAATPLQLCASHDGDSETDDVASVLTAAGARIDSVKPRP